jgi:hypothetical protein
MTSEKAFQLYFAIRLHFTSDYDVFERGTNFRGRSKLTSRNDFNLIYPYLSIVDDERSMIELCVANNLYDNPEFLYDQDWAKDNYLHWCKVKESLEHTLDRDLCHIELSSLKLNVTLDDYMKQHVINDLLSQRIEYETIILLNRKIGVIDMIQGFDSSKYRVRMHKASKFVNKGTLGLRHISRIDSFLATMKGSHHGNNSI